MSKKPMLVVEAIPYSNFKEKIRLIKHYNKIGIVEIYDNYIYVERLEVAA